MAILRGEENKCIHPVRGKSLCDGLRRLRQKYFKFHNFQGIGSIPPASFFPALHPRLAHLHLCREGSGSAVTDSTQGKDR